MYFAIVYEIIYPYKVSAPVCSLHLPPFTRRYSYRLQPDAYAKWCCIASREIFYFILSKSSEAREWPRGLHCTQLIGRNTATSMVDHTRGVDTDSLTSSRNQNGIIQKSAFTYSTIRCNYISVEPHLSAHH